MSPEISVYNAQVLCLEHHREMRAPAFHLLRLETVDGALRLDHYEARGVMALTLGRHELTYYQN